MATLGYINDQGEEDLVHVGEDRPEVTVGRHNDCDLRTKNNTVSRKHARFLFRDGSYFLEDLNSANGTYFRREKIESVELVDGETIYCGTFQVEFKLDDRDRATVEDSLEPPPVPGTDGNEPVAEPEPDEIESDGTPEQTMGYEAPSEANQPVSLEALEESDEEVVSFTDDPMEETAFQGAEDEPQPFGREDTTDVVSEVVRIGSGAAPDAKRMLEEEKERESRAQELTQKLQELEKDLEERDDTVRRLASQVEDLGNMVARYEAERADAGDTELRIADLEKVIASSESEKESLEAALNAAKEDSERARKELDEAVARAGELEGEVAALSLKVEELNARLADTSELDRLKTEAEGGRERVSQLEQELKQAWEKVAGVEKELAETKARAEEAAREAARQADKLASESESTARELAEVKTANRSYLKKISRLIEAAPAKEAAAGGPADVSKAIDEINEMISGSRTSLDILAGMLPDVAEHMDGSDEGAEALDQVRTSAEDLTKTVKAVKKKVLDARALFKEK